jgi:hypothetical protein
MTNLSQRRPHALSVLSILPKYRIPYLTSGKQIMFSMHRQAENLSYFVAIQPSEGARCRPAAARHIDLELG